MGELEGSPEGALIAGKYLIKRRIGAGGMGAVYEGEHVEIGKRVAIKVIAHEHARSAELAARFRREARAASAVESEHIVQVFDVGEDDAVGLYMVMELLAGEDLASRLENAGGRIPVAEAVTIIAQAGRALGKAHAAGVVHRDLKPANLFLTTREDGSISVKILDFGISKLVRGAQEEGQASAKTSLLTREGAVMGTPMYMSPEQAQGLPVDARSDVWSLASVLYEALAGRTAYEARDTYEQMIVQIVTKKPLPIEQIAPWVPGSIARVLETALAHDVEQRSSDAALFAKNLTEAAREADEQLSGAKAVDAPSSGRMLAAESSVSGASARSAASPPTAAGVVVAAREPRAEGAPRRGRTAVIAGGALMLATGAAALVWATRTHAPTGAAQVGLVAPPPSAEISASPAPSTSSSAIVTILPVLVPSLVPSAAPRVLATSAGDAGAARSPTKPTSTAATPPTSTTTTKGGPSQYGAAGVSTAY